VDQYTGIRERLRRARSVAVLTGAGVSAESGVPTFRGPDGLWRRHRPEDLATPEAFRRDPALVWEWYDWRRGLVARCRPNPAHEALAELERRIPDFRLITQNVDGLHRKAGSRRLVELHGCLWRVRCTAEATVRDHTDGTPLTSVADESHRGQAGEILPRWLGEA
jgi:NAD-dependent deacetylase